MSRYHIDVDVVILDATEVEARIEVRTRLSGNTPANRDVQLRGAISGPFCENVRTLPAKIPFRVDGGDDGYVAEVVVVDPCYWSPELPYVYRVEIEVEWDGAIERHEQSVGLARTRQTRRSP